MPAGRRGPDAGDAGLIAAAKQGEDAEADAHAEA